MECRKDMLDDSEDFDEYSDSESKQFVCDFNWQHMLLCKISLVVYSKKLIVNLGIPLRGLARYCVHTTATWDQFWNIIKQFRNHSDGVSLVSP